MRPWHQITIDFPGGTRHDREQAALDHLHRVIPDAQDANLIRSWWFIRKGSWRIRYQITGTPGRTVKVHKVLSAGTNWIRDIYEPETRAFGGPDAMDLTHTLFHQDSSRLLTYLRQNPLDRREHSLILCTALMRAAALDLNEQGDVWAKVLNYRIDDLRGPPAPDATTWVHFTGDVRRLLHGAPNITEDWQTAFTDTGTQLQHLRDTGKLTRGLRAVIALHIIFHFNRIGLPATTQARLAQAAAEAIFDDAPASSTRWPTT